MGLKSLANSTLQNFNTSQLKAWFQAEKRDLPWRQLEDPYAIWISEVMLQQTQAAVVIPYFLHWMKRFPTIRHLAEATLDEVIKAWEGLGYYSRVRYLHEGAKYIVEHFQGQLPNDEEKLKKIKGLGPYTIGAILSFAFHQRKAAVDGNVLRVLTRYFGIEEDIAKIATVKKLTQFLQTLLPEEEPWIINEALIELGATICQRKARCSLCPLQSQCVAFREEKMDCLPVKSKGASTTYLYRAVAVIQTGDLYLVKRGKKGEIMSDLYEFPYFEIAQEGITPQEFQVRWIQHYCFPLMLKQTLSVVNHGFTRYQARLDPVWFTCQTPLEIEEFHWLSVNELKKFAFSSGHRRIFQEILTLLK